MVQYLIEDVTWTTKRDIVKDYANHVENPEIGQCDSRHQSDLKFNSMSFEEYIRFAYKVLFHKVTPQFGSDCFGWSCLNPGWDDYRVIKALKMEDGTYAVLVYDYNNPTMSGIHSFYRVPTLGKLKQKLSKSEDVEMLEESVNKKLVESAVQVQETLNPALWDGDKLKPEVIDTVKDIVELFLEESEIPIDVLDIYLVGSNASFNYAEHSDLDIHIVSNYELIDENIPLVQAALQLQKASFNNSYNISIHGVPVELYVEDVNAGTVSNGIYSVFEEKWIKYPQPIEVQEYNLDYQIAKWGNVIEGVLEEHDEQAITDCINTLYMMRKNSLAVDGEYGPGNQLFKAIRNEGLLDALKEALKAARSENLTLESLVEE